jgi:ABC-type oligopeptide transport system substrate-binding subunit
MKPQIKTNRNGWENERSSAYVCVYLWLISLILVFSGCNQLEKPKPQPFYSQTAPPKKQEFRWSNGKMPKSFDPALATAPPETDIVRAIYEGLTDNDPKTLQPVAAIAVDWKSSEDYKTWTFNLRRNAKWSNGERVTAKDFVSSWKRLAEMGEEISHYELLNNIVGMQAVEKLVFPSDESRESNNVSRQFSNQDFTSSDNQVKPNATDDSQERKLKKDETDSTSIPEERTKQKTKIKEKNQFKFGVEVIDDYTLRVSLVKSDRDFPALVAHPIFRPVYRSGKEFESGKLNGGIVTNGAFHVSSVGLDGITLDRAENYWNAKEIKIERVRFVQTENAEKALEAYRAGEIDAVTNADFEPLALKLLTPFDDFRRTTHSALNFYEFNLKKPPFDDRRIREALAIAIERERLTEGEMESASEPAFGFLPFDKKQTTKLTQNTQKARNLIMQAGFPNGENFPIVKLLVNRNDVQQRIARSVAKMWKQNLNIETEITVKESAELENIGQTTDFDLIRRGVVLPTTDEAANMLAIFSFQSKTNKNLSEIKKTGENDGKKNNESEKAEKSNNDLPVSETQASERLSDNILTSEETTADTLKKTEGELILTEEEAIIEFPAIPLYFSTSYSLIKPYVQGFETNTLDAPSLKDIRIDDNWQPKRADGES